MLNANIKKVISILIAFALLLIVGCSSPEEKRAKALADAAQLQANSDYITALELLENLSQSYPDDSEILQQIGLIHQQLGNSSEAAFYLGAAQTLSPDDTELLFQAYRAHENANQLGVATDLLKTFAKKNPSGMTVNLWFRLGELQAQARKTESALESYLEGIKLSNEKPSAETALAIGTLFKQLDNLPMAGRWFVIAAKSDDPSALPALFGLLEIHLRSKNWEAAEKTIALIDKKFPGAVDASEWAGTREELRKWRAAQNEMKAQLEKIALAKQQEQKALAEKEASAQTEDNPTDLTTVTQQKSGKEQIVNDLANAEAIASQPATEAVPDSTSEIATEETELTEPEIVYNENIIVQPAEPIADFDDEAEQETQEFQSSFDDSTNYQSSTAPIEPLSPYEPEPGYSSEPEPEYNSELVAPKVNESPLPDTQLLSLEELIARAREATSKRNYDQAIQLYWDALGRTNQRADIWNALSKVYLIHGQAKNAATTALEATRLEPDNVLYVLDYLRVVQRVKKPADFIRELETAYDRFPRSPEITLSLARGYRRIGGNDYAASILYRRFIQIAPNHPLRPEAEAALSLIRLNR